MNLSAGPFGSTVRKMAVEADGLLFSGKSKENSRAAIRERSFSDGDNSVIIDEERVMKQERVDNEKFSEGSGIGKTG